MNNGQNHRPESGGGVPVLGAVCKDSGVQVAVGHAEEGVHDERQQNRRHHGGEADNRLDHLGCLPGRNLRHADGDEHGDDQVNDDPHQVVANGVADHHPGVFGLEQEFKVIQADPGALENALCKIHLLKCDQNTKHGQVVVGKEVNQAREHHQIQGQIPLAFFLLADLLALRQNIIIFRHSSRSTLRHTITPYHIVTIIIPLQTALDIKKCTPGFSFSNQVPPEAVSQKPLLPPDSGHWPPRR